MATYTKGTLSKEMLESSSDLSNIVSHRKGNSFREFVHRQVDEARISIVATNFGSIQRESSVTQPIITPDKEDSLHVTPSGDIVQQDREKGSNRPSLYDVDRFIGDEEESTEDGTESSIETREYVEGRVEDGGETLEGDGEGRTGEGEEKEEEDVKDEPKAEEGEEGKEDGSGEKPGIEEEGVSGEERETENTGENVEDGGAIPEDGRGEDVEEGERAGEVEEKAGDEQEKIGDGEVVDDEQGKLVDEGEKSEEGQDKGEKSEEGQDKGEISEEGQDKGEQSEERQDKGEGDETKEEESGITQSEEGAQEKESDVEQESREKDEEKEQVENEEDKKTRIGGEDEKAGEEEDKDEEKDEEKEDELVQEIMTRAIQSVRADDLVSLGLGSSDIGLKGESVSSSIEHEKLTERLKQINFELSYVNRKNRFLTKAVVDIRGRKADIDTGDSKLTEGYLKKLVHFEKIKFSIQNEMKKIADQVESLRESSKSAGEMYDAAQEDFLQKVADAYKRLDSNSASEKTIIQPTPRIQTALANVSKMRLKMIKLQNHLAEKEAQLKSLDDRGGGLHLIDYEKLKMHNQHLIETIAERDLELLRLRKKIETDTQKLAHVRERAKIIGEENRDYHATLEELDTQIKLAREDVNNKKQKRQRITVETRKMRQDAGLLTKPKLVTSFRQTELDLEAAKNQFNDIMQVYHQQKKKIVDLKERLHSSTELSKIN